MLFQLQMIREWISRDDESMRNQLGNWISEKFLDFGER